MKGHVYLFITKCKWIISNIFDYICRVMKGHFYLYKYIGGLVQKVQVCLFKSFRFYSYINRFWGLLFSDVYKILKWLFHLVIGPSIHIHLFCIWFKSLLFIFLKFLFHKSFLYNLQEQVHLETIMRVGLKDLLLFVILTVGSHHLSFNHRFLSPSVCCLEPYLFVMAQNNPNRGK